jgi:TANFOR domain-containing protein
MKSLHFCKPLQQYLPLYLPDYKLFTNLKQANLHMRRQLLISLLLLFLVARSAMAQTFPVQASTNIVPPYSTLLADYVAPGSQRLALNIFLADLNRPQLQTRLRLRIEGEGISITTRPSFMPPPLILQGGIPERLTGTDLAEYFLPQNLDFTGITRRQFESTGKLPEGLYRFCFEILEYNRGVKVSNAACTMAWLILNDPPLINWPDQGEKLTPQDPQYITFQWTPRHTGSPNSAFTTEYDFALVELWPANRNPNDAILTTPPIFETTTQSTTLIYGPEATPLVPGRSYAFRVRARAIIGTESYDLFKNQGYSEAIGFVYGDACTLPTNINARATSGERFNISWEPATVHTNFNVRYRPAIRTADQWYEETTFLQNLDIGGLTAETTYEYQVAAGCGPFLSEYSDIASVTTESRPPVNYTCGLPPEEYSFENREPLPQLNVDDVVLVGDFEVRMMEVSGSNGNFSGKGRALVPYLDNMLVVVEFDQVSVNTDYRMTGGQMDVKGFGADILPDEVNDFLDELDESLDAIENTLDDIATGLDVADSIADQVQDLANDILDDGPLTIEDEERLDAATVAMYLEGAQQAAGAAAGALAAALTPESIETAAREVARAMELTKRGKRLRQIHDNADTLDAIAVEFFASENYGFDISRYRQHRLHYNIMVTADDETHRIPWVATAAGQQETVSARLTGNTGTDAADVAFESDGTALQATMTGDTWSITLPAMEAGAQRSIVALSSTTGATLGKLDAIAYEPIGRKVNLVPVGSTPAGLNAGDILTALNNTYRQAVASWEVAVLDPLKVDGYTGTLQDDEQALLSVYSTGMREIIRAFEATGAVNEDEFYLFLVDRSQVGNTGYMPRKHRYGFIYMEDNPDVSRTVAHELGHGAFRLQHTFEEYPTIGGPRSTANLMDYGTGTKLRKYQWDLIHNPPLVIGLLEDEGEGAYVVSDLLALNIETSVNNPSAFFNTYAFSTPAGGAIDLPKEISKLRFNRNTMTLYEFELDGVRYVTAGTKGGTGFLGYVPVSVLTEAGYSDGDVLTDGFKQTIINNRYSLKAASGKRIYGMRQELLGAQVYAICYCSYNWEADPLAETYGQFKTSKTLPESALIGSCTGHECDELNLTSQALGTDFYAYVKRAKESQNDPLSSDQEILVKELANHLDGLLYERSFAFYGYGLEAYGSGEVIHTDIKAYFVSQEIFTVSEFEASFPFLLDSRDKEVIVSSVDLWAGIPKGYNTNTIDHVAKDRGEVKNYEYSFADLKTREEYIVEETVIKTSILKFEREGNAQPLATHENYDQYVAEFGTDAAFPFIAKAAAEWSKDLLAAIFLRQLAAEYGVMLMNEAIKRVGQEAVKKLIKEKGKDFIQGAVIDYGIQATFSYAFDDKSFAEAASPENINWISVGASGLESTLTINNKYAEYDVTVSFACFVNGWSDAGGFKDDFDVTNCAIGVVGAVLGKQVPLVFKYLKKYASYSVSKLKTGLAKLNITGQQADEIIEKIKNSVDEGSSSSPILDGAQFFDDNVIDIAEVGLKNWKTFQNRVATQLKALYPSNLIGSQVTLDVTYIENGITKTKTIIPDDLIQIEINGVKKYKVVDAKTSTKDLVTKTDLTSTCTKNQQIIYPLIDGGGNYNGISITKVEMRGANAQSAFGENVVFNSAGKAQIQLDTGVEFWINSSTEDYTQYIIRSRIQ